MNRFIVKYSNGKIRQQPGLNGTFHYMLSIGVISWIIDTEKGEIMFGDKDENVSCEKIPKYNASDLIIENK